jgi:hypothetical protein
LIKRNKNSNNKQQAKIISSFHRNKRERGANGRGRVGAHRGLYLAMSNRTKVRKVMIHYIQQLQKICPKCSRDVCYYSEQLGNLFIPVY